MKFGQTIPARVFVQFKGRNFTTHHNCLIRQAVKYVVQLIADRIWKLYRAYCRISAIRRFVYLHKTLDPAFPKSSAKMHKRCAMREQNSTFRAKRTVHYRSLFFPPSLPPSRFFFFEKQEVPAAVIFCLMKIVRADPR